MSTLDEILAHHGVKGMKWGIRRSGLNIGKIYRKPTAGPPSSADRQKAESARSKVVKGKTHALSNDELQSLVKRMNLEQQYANLTTKEKGKSKVATGHEFVKSAVGVATLANTAVGLANSPVGKGVGHALAAAAKKK